MNYFCTWSVQNYLYGCGKADFQPEEAEGATGAAHARANMNLENLLGEQGWARRFYPAARGQLYFLLDDGWDVPQSADARWFGALIPDAGRFPGGPEAPWERLSWLNQQVKEAGWRGLGLWVAAQEAPALFSAAAGDLQAQERYWAERMCWSERAGVEYWKVDWGAHGQDWEFRARLTRWARQYAPHLTIEHAVCQGPVNDGPDGRLREEIAGQEAHLLLEADVLRTYDILQPLSASQTMERVGALLHAMEGRAPKGRALINCEDECYLAAALGLCAGVMRHPLRGLRCKGDMDPAFPPTADDAKLRMDEVARLARWQSVMPPFGAAEEPVRIDRRVLRDSWRFARGETWMSDLIGQELTQAAPARISRGADLPTVRGRTAVCRRVLPWGLRRHRPVAPHAAPPLCASGGCRMASAARGFRPGRLWLLPLFAHHGTGPLPRLGQRPIGRPLRRAALFPRTAGAIGRTNSRHRPGQRHPGRRLCAGRTHHHRESPAVRSQVKKRGEERKKVQKKQA